jgi:hypothetical protein
VDTLNSEDLLLFAMTAREIWRRRNIVLHGGVFTHSSMMANFAGKSFRQFQYVNSKDPTQEGVVSAENGVSNGNIRRAPPQGVYKANWDFAVSSENQCIGVRVIIHYGNGLVSVAKIVTIFAMFDPIAGEALAALHVAEFCCDLGIFEVILEGDSLTVTRAIKGKREN